MHDFMPIDEVELGERKDPVTVERRLEREVLKPIQRLDGGQTRHLQRRFDPAALAIGDLLGQQRLDRLDCAQLAALEVAASHDRAFPARAACAGRPGGRGFECGGWRHGENSRQLSDRRY